MKKIVILLIVYFAGFATAIYFLAPSSAQGQVNNTASSYNSQEFAQDFKTGVDKCIEYAKETSVKAYSAAKDKIQQRNSKE